jgi:nucleoside-diphosphate-sugar epimerase
MFADAAHTSGQVFNIAVGERITINELYRHLQEIIGSTLQPIYREERHGDVKHSLADISKAKQLLGYEPGVKVRKGLEETIRWVRLVK